MHPFDNAMNLVTTDATPRTPASVTFRGRTTAAYANMVGPFGGTTAACLLQAAMLHPARQGDPIALTVNFAAALVDGDFDITACPVRTSRTVQHWSIELVQAGEAAATATAVFALRRDTWSEVEADMPAIAARETLPPASLQGRPAWVKRYDMRFAHGALPDVFDEVPHHESASLLYVSDAPPRALDFASLAALCDTFFPRIYLRRRKWLPIGTVSLTTYFHADASMLQSQGETPLVAEARAINFRNGFFDQTAKLWGEGGQLFASTHQIVYFKA